MTNVVSDAFCKASMLALEDWGMLFVEPCDAPSEALREQSHLFVCSMEFRGVMDGQISIVCPRALLQVVRANVLGVSEDDVIDEEESKDVLTELTNILSGNFLTESYGEDVVFELVFPKSEVCTEEMLAELAQRRSVHGFLADELPVLVTLDQRVE